MSQTQPEANAGSTARPGQGSPWVRDRNLLNIRVWWALALGLQVAVTLVAMIPQPNLVMVGILAVGASVTTVVTLCFTAVRPLPNKGSGLKDRAWADPGLAAIKLLAILALCMEALSTLVGAWMGAKSPGDVARISAAVEPLSRLMSILILVAVGIAVWRQLATWCCGGPAAPDGVEMPEYAALQGSENTRLISSEV